MTENERQAVERLQRAGCPTRITSGALGLWAAVQAARLALVVAGGA